MRGRTLDVAGFMALALALAGAVLAPGGLLAQTLVVRIGHVAPLNGPLRPVGLSSEQGAQLAIDELNAQGLKFGHQSVKLELMAEDDAGDPKQATAAAQKLVDAKVSGVVGHVQSFTSLPASRIYAGAGIPQITPSAQGPLLTRQGLKSVFRLVPTDDDVAAAGVKFAGKQGVAQVLKRPRGHVTDQGLDALRREVRSVKPDTLFYDGPLSEAMKWVPSSVKIIVATQCDEQRLSVAAKAYCASIQVPPGGGYSDFAAKFKAKYGREPDAVAPYAYDAVKVMVAAMKAAGSAEPAKYLPHLAKTSNYQGATGSISFNARGDLTAPRVYFYGVTPKGLSHSTTLVAESGTDGGCAESCKYCCSDKNGKYCGKDDKCNR